MAKYKMVNGVNVQLTAEEETELETMQTQMAVDDQAREDAKAVVDANKASGKVKLKSGDALNDDEIAALFG
jgi:hypothetical protein